METEPLVLPVEADDANYQAGMDRVEKRLTSVSKKMMSIGTKMSLAITLPLSIMAKQSVTAFADFNEAMTKSTSIISGMTAENRAAMEAQAKAIASSTRTSATKAAEAYYYLASAGLDAAQAIGALPIVEKFATAGAFDMARATELLADSQSALGLAVGSTAERMAQMTRVSDVLVDAANMSNASVEQFAKALTTKSAAALRGMNKEVEEGVAVLGVYADAGIKGELAGEKLSIMLRETQNAAMKEAAAWKSLGISLYDANGRMKNLADVVELLETATAGMSDQQKVARFAMLGLRSESIDAIRPLMGMTDKIRAYEARLKAAGGTTKNVAEKQMTSFSAQLDILRNQMTLAAIEIGEVLAPSVMKLNRALASGLNYWRSLSNETKQFTVHMAKVIALMGPGLVMFSKTTSAVSTMTPALVKASSYARMLAVAATGAFAAFAAANPITLAIIGIGTAIAGVVAWLVGPEGLVNAWEKSKLAAQSFTTSSMSFIQNFTANTGILFTWIGDNWKTILLDMADATLTFAMNMASNFGVALKTTMRLFVAFYGWLWQVSTKFWTFIFSEEFAVAVKNGAVAALNGIIDFAKRSWMAIQAFAIAAGAVFMSLAKGAVDIFLAIPGAIWGVLVKTASAFKDAMYAILSGQLPDIKKFMSDIAAAAKAEFEQATVAVGTAINVAADVIGDKMTDITTQATADFNKGMSDPNFFNTAKDILAEGMSEMVKPLEGFQARTMAPQFIKGAQEMAAEAIVAGEAIGELGKTEDASKGIKKATKAVTDLQKAASKKVKMDLGKPVEAVEAFTSEALSHWIQYQKDVAKVQANSKVKIGPGAGALPAGANVPPLMLGGVNSGGLKTDKLPPGVNPQAANYVAAVADSTMSAGNVSSTSVADSSSQTVTLLSQIEKNTRTGGIVIKQVSGM